MDCMKVQTLIGPYLEGQLSDRELSAFLDHVEKCPQCRDELEIYFAIYRTLGGKDDGDYNFTKKLDASLLRSREYLKRRRREKFLKIAVITAAEGFFLFGASGLVREGIDDWKRNAAVSDQTESEAETEVFRISSDEVNSR